MHRRKDSVQEKANVLVSRKALIDIERHEEGRHYCKHLEVDPVHAYCRSFILHLEPA